MQIVDAAVVADDRIIRTGTLKIATAGGHSALSAELDVMARLTHLRNVPEVLAWAATPDGNQVAAILFKTGTLTVTREEDVLQAVDTSDVI